MYRKDYNTSYAKKFYKMSLRLNPASVDVSVWGRKEEIFLGHNKIQGIKKLTSIIELLYNITPIEY